METNNKSKKISELQTLQTLASISKNKANTWFPAALYNSYNNSYSNIAVSIEAITNYCNSYTSYMLSYTLENNNSTNVTYNITYTNSELQNNEELIAYCTDYTYNIIHSEVEKISNNMVNLINKIKNQNSSNSYIRNNSKKISELTPRDTITYHKDHSWFAVAQYDSRVNAYVNLAMNLDTITGYCNTYSAYLIAGTKDIIDNDIRELTYELMTYTVSYVGESLSFQYLEEGYEPQITLEDIQDIVLNKKLVTLNSENYTQEAFEYIKNKVFENESILFDTYNHLIWTLGNHFGSDVLKKDLLYYSKIQSVNINHEFINELESQGPEQTLAFKENDGIKINVYRYNDKDVVSLRLNLDEVIRKDTSDKYVLYIDGNNKVGIKKYENPIISVDTIEYNEQDIIEVGLNIETFTDIEDWKTFDVEGINCEILEIDREYKKLKIQINPDNYKNDVDENIIIHYDDRYSSGDIVIDHIFKTCCYYGIYNQENFDFIELGKYEVNNQNIGNIFNINQYNQYYGYFRCPKKYTPIFIDNLRYMEGAWIKQYDVIINSKKYSTYMTQNLGLGNIQWKVLENIR